MFNALLLSSFAAMALAAPVEQEQFRNIPTLGNPSWTPAPGSKTICDANTQQVISLDLEPQIETVLNGACAELMPPCAYPELLPEDTICIKTVVWPLEKAVESTQTLATQTLEGEENAEGKVKFSVTPAEQPKDAPPVQWTKQECFGYFAQMLQKSQPEGCRSEEGFGVGKMVVDGESAFNFKGTTFEISIVEEEE